MPQITLISSGVAYNLYTLLAAADGQTPKSCSGLTVQVPPTAVEAANAGVIVKIGRPNSASSPTSITNAEVVLQEGGSDSWPNTSINDVSLLEKYVNGSNNNTVLYITTVQA